MNKIYTLSAAISLCLSTSALAIEERSYFSDVLKVGDGKSAIYSVELDADNNKALLTLLPSGLVNYEHIDALAASPDGKVLWLISSRNGIAHQLISYEVITATLGSPMTIHLLDSQQSIGNITKP